MDARACLHCGASLEGKQKDAKYCSKQCKSQASFLRFAARSRGEDVPLIEYHRQRTICPYCGEIVKAYQRVYCNSEHARLHRTRHKQVVHVPPDRVHPLVRLERKVPKESRARLFYAGWCFNCGEAFIAPASGGPSIYCSSICGRRSAHAKRRARKADAVCEPIYRQKIYNRDQWVCQLCMTPIDRAQTAPQPLAPTLDHVIPLALGGSHTMSNMQAAHFICNCTKGDRVTDDVRLTA